jgi:hypothetical protein
VCTNPQAIEEHRSHLSYLASEKASLEAALSARREEFEQVTSYETERAVLQPASRDALLSTLGLGHTSFLEFRAELCKLEAFLGAQAQAEVRYAEQLEAQHQAYYPSVEDPCEQQQPQGGEGGEGSPRKRATTTELVSKTLEYLHVKEDTGSGGSSLPAPSDSANRAVTGNVRKASFQFFSGFSEFNRSSANKHRDFGAFIADSVLGDVKELVAEVDEGEPVSAPPLPLSGVFSNDAMLCTRM